MRALYLLAPIALAGSTYTAAQSLAAHDWLVAVPLLVILAVGLVLIAPGKTPEAASEARPSASAQHPRCVDAAAGKGGVL